MKTLLRLLAAATLLVVAHVQANSPVPTDRPQRPRVTVWGSHVTGPLVTRRVAPAYPKLPGRVSGVIIFEVRLDERGNVVDVRVLKPGMGATTEAAMKAIRQWKFKPAEVNRTAMPSIEEVAIHYGS
ncbi:MAG TPA: TonB family protein [Thermoanaerobaculia bacterium]|nr:TonB family protein [Thermoanaerobaculia bacterium]